MDGFTAEILYDIELQILVLFSFWRMACFPPHSLLWKFPLKPENQVITLINTELGVVPAWII